MIWKCICQLSTAQIADIWNSTRNRAWWDLEIDNLVAKRDKGRGQVAYIEEYITIK